LPIEAEQSFIPRLTLEIAGALSRTSNQQ